MLIFKFIPDELELEEFWYGPVVIVSQCGLLVILTPQY